MIVTMIPYCPSERGTNLGYAYNQQVERLRDDDWACFIDHDACFTTREWYPQLEAITKKLDEAAVLTAKTNRVGSPWQIAPGVDPNNHSMEYHRSVGERILRDFGVKLRTIIAADGYMSGVVILLSKTTWKLLGGFTDGFLGVDTDLHRTAAAKGVSVYLMEGVYVYHWYRADTGGLPVEARSLSDLRSRTRQEQGAETLSPDNSETIRHSPGTRSIPMAAPTTVAAGVGGREAASQPSSICLNEQESYQEAVDLALHGQLDSARERYRQLDASISSERQKAMIHNDLAAISAAAGDIDDAIAGFQAAISIDSSLAMAREPGITLCRRRLSVIFGDLPYQKCKSDSAPRHRWKSGYSKFPVQLAVHGRRHCPHGGISPGSTVRGLRSATLLLQG